jgi:hypothetical protein
MSQDNRFARLVYETVAPLSGCPPEATDPLVWKSPLWQKASAYAIVTMNRALRANFIAQPLSFSRSSTGFVITFWNRENPR